MGRVVFGLMGGSGLVVCLLVTVLVACGGGESPGATVTPMPATPAATPTQPPETPSPPVTAGATSTPTPAATPMPTVEPSPTATPSPPPAIDYTPLVLGEPRYQLAGYALFSRIRGCFWNCDVGTIGIVRTVFDERAGEIRADNPLASLEDRGAFVNFGMNEDGTLMAAAVCVVGHCGGVDQPSDDAEQEV